MCVPAKLDVLPTSTTVYMCRLQGMIERWMSFMRMYDTHELLHSLPHVLTLSVVSKCCCTTL